MSLRPSHVTIVPEDTVQVTRAAFPRGCLLMTLRDELGSVFDDQRFSTLFPVLGQPAEAPWRLALVTLLQFAEGLSDRQAADAVRGRIDWKYLLALPLTDAGFDSSVLCEFRARLVAGQAEAVLFDTVLDIAKARHLVRADGRQRTDSTRVVAAVRGLNRLAGVTEAMRHALEAAAIAAPDWLRTRAEATWVARYEKATLASRMPKSERARLTLARDIGTDGDRLLAAIHDADAPPRLRAHPAIETLRRMWIQQFFQLDGDIHWRTAIEGIPPAAQFIGTPHDPDAHYARKNAAGWVGYKVHLTETCDADTPRIITHVQTSTAPVNDEHATRPTHLALERKGLLPAQHFVDTGYISAGILVSTQQRFGVDLIGPVRRDMRWQALARKGFTTEAFSIDWDKRAVTCPSGAVSSSWTAAIDNGTTPVFKIKFSRKDCGTCTHRIDCAGAKRIPTLHHTSHAGSAQRLDRWTKTPANCGVREAVRVPSRHRGERCPKRSVSSECAMLATVGQAKVRLQHLETATAMNLMRLAHWMTGDPIAKTRTSHFARLMAQPAPS